MAWHLIQDDIEQCAVCSVQCAACAARARGERTLDLSGSPSTPLCVPHVNVLFEKMS